MTTTMRCNSTGSKRARSSADAASSSAASIAAVDPRVVIVKSDKVRSRIADLSSFVDGIEAEREAALTKICDLESTVEELRLDNERIPDLQKDVEYYSTKCEKEKKDKEAFEMELRDAKAEILRCNAAATARNKELTGYSKMLKNRDAQIDHLNKEHSKLKSEMAASLSQHQDTVAALDRGIQEKNAACQAMTETLNAAVFEVKKLGNYAADMDRLKSELERANGEYEDLKTDLLESDRAKERMEQRLSASEAETARMKERLSVLFIDAYQLSAEGTGYLLGSGRMLSLHSIARAWARDEGFNGDPTYHIKCIETSTFTTVVRSPAVTRFTRDVADIIGLNTVPEFHFRFSDHPIGTLPIRWTVYNPHDQLTLVAKLVYIAKANTASISIPVMVMDSHLVTATCTKNMATGDANITFTLNVVTRAGIAQPHHIEFVAVMDGDDIYFPSEYEFTLGAAAQ